MSEAMYQDPKERAGDTPKTVTLSGPDLRAAARLLTLLTGREDGWVKEFGNADQTPSELNAGADRGVLVERARRTFLGRQRRSQIFSGAMFGEPAWDMLLALYVTEKSGARHTIVRLMAQSGAPATTALRWLDYLDKERLVTRQPNPIDKRASFIKLTNKARDALDAYFSGTASTENLD
jgi:DNA-binding MarR family transcriptional regulator